MPRPVATVLLSLALASCAPADLSPSAALPLRLNAEPSQLRVAAEKALRRAGMRITSDPSAPEMRVRESAGESVESVGDDGSPNFYAVRYELSYQLGARSPRRISDSRIVAHAESRLLAERRRRAAVVSDLRRRALDEMLYLLKKESHPSPR